MPARRSDAVVRPEWSVRCIAGGLLAISLVSAAPCRGAEPAPLVLEAKIALGPVRGRIDHLAIDPARQRLFVAELGNDSVAVVDLRQRQVRRITGLRQPQGVGYVASTDTLYVANAGDGAVELFQSADLTPGGRIELGNDADNIRVDAAADRVLVGYGDGAIALIDPASRAKVGAIPLSGHPESFQLTADGRTIFANVPDARQIAVVDRLAARQRAAIPARDAAANFAMAIDGEARRLLVVFRRPARLVAYAMADGNVAAGIETCGDADDVFVDARRRRVYVSCGAGVVDVLDAGEAQYRRLGRLPTAAGARTSLLVPELDRLYLAVRATGSESAAIWVLRPQP